MAPHHSNVAGTRAQADLIVAEIRKAMADKAKIAPAIAKSATKTESRTRHTAAALHATCASPAPSPLREQVQVL